MRLARIGLVVAVFVAAVAFAGVGRPDRAATATPAARSITVTGSGAASAVPNRVAFDFGVQTRGKTAVGALAENATAVRKLIAALEAAGVPKKSIQTSGISLSPNYSNDGSDIVGYTASNSVSATIADINRAGAVVDAAVGAGANQVNGPTFTQSDQARLYRIALRAAIANARAKAATIASASRLRLGAIRSVTESSASSPVGVPAAKAGVAEGTPVEPGTQTVEADVTVVFSAT